VEYHKIWYGTTAFSALHKLPLTINDKLKPVIFADDTSIIVINHNPDDFKEDIINVLDNINIWFNSNLLSLKFW